MILEDKVNFNQEKFKLICLSALALDIPLNFLKIPENHNDLYLTISLIFSTLEKYDELIRRAVTLLEQIERQNYEEGYYGLIKDYLSKFNELSQFHPNFKVDLDDDQREKIALNLLINLLFYTGKNGLNYLRSELTSRN
jgi:hypothetical protein